MMEPFRVNVTGCSAEHKAQVMGLITEALAAAGYRPERPVKPKQPHLRLVASADRRSS